MSIATTLGLLWAWSAQANEHERFRHFLSMSLEELMEQKVSISTQTALALSKAPATVSVITADDIKATGATNLAEVLQTVPGIYVRYQHFAMRPLITFRGANNKQTLLMVDGVPFSDLMWRLGIFWKGLPTSMIERVEIIRGPGSALFGTDASAGVVNVITKAAGGIEGSEVGLRLGSYDTQNAWLEYGQDWHGVDLALTVDLFKTDGHDPRIRADAQTRNDATFDTNASLAPADAHYGWDNADLRFSLAHDAWRLQVDYARHDNLETGMTGAGALDPVTEGEDSRFQIELAYANQDFSPTWGLDAELRYRHIEYDSGNGFQEWPPGYLDATGLYPQGVINHYDSAEHGVSGELGGVFKGIDGHVLRLGAGFRWQDVYRVEHAVNSGVDGSGMMLPAGGPVVDISDTPYAFAPEKDRTIHYLYLQDIWTLNQAWELTLGARYDHHSDFGSSFNPRLALVWQTSDTLTTKLLYGEAFRAPYFQELFTETSFALPNPDLEPEQSETWELSLAYRPSSDLHLGLNLFRFEQRDFISRQAVEGLSKSQFLNVGEHVIKGLELEGWWQPEKGLRLSANYSYNDPDDSPFRTYGLPNHQAYARIDWQFEPGWHWNIQANWFGDIERRPGDSRPDIEDFLVADTTLRYLGQRDWELAVSLRNMFDEDARAHTGGAIPDDLPLPDRNLYAEIQFNLDSFLR